MSVPLGARPTGWRRRSIARTTVLALVAAVLAVPTAAAAQAGGLDPATGPAPEAPAPTAGGGGAAATVAERAG